MTGSSGKEKEGREGGGWGKNRCIYKETEICRGPQETDRQNEAEVGRECCGVWEAQVRRGSV